MGNILEEQSTNHLHYQNRHMRNLSNVIKSSKKQQINQSNKKHLPIRKSISPTPLNLNKSSHHSNLFQRKPIFKNSYPSKQNNPAFNHKNFKSNIKLDCKKHQSKKQTIEKCAQVYRRIKNFNEFLNEVRKRLNNTSKIVNQSNSAKNCQILFKLDNQKVQVEKYTNIIKREMSKHHLIQKIEIEDKSQGKNTIKIFYEDIQPKTNKTNKNSHFKIKQTPANKYILSNEKKNTSKLVSDIEKLFTKVEDLQSFQIESDKIISQILKYKQDASQKSSFNSSIHINSMNQLAESKLSSKIYFH